ncbi:hypothetical protein D924_02881, partial [Enterococcus faecalis 06-MB-S-10]
KSLNLLIFEFLNREVNAMKTGFFKTKYRTEKGLFTCKWLMLLDKCFFVKHKKVA